jgi:phage terminase large subunit GpA-like protein
MTALPKNISLADELLRGFADGLRPEPIMTVSEWSDQYRFLSATASAEPGQWRTSRVPYLREIMDNLSSQNPIQEIVFMKGAQIGATEIGNCWLGYCIHISPGPMLMVMPTDDTVKRNSKIRIDPMIEASPVLRDRIKPARSRDSGNTTRSKEFPGGVLVMTGANSAVGLRSMPVSKLFLDECDGYKLDLDGEGSPIDLARARTRTFANRKIFIVSTPTIAGASAIEREFDATDQRKYNVPCPHCGLLQPLEFERLKWETTPGDSGRKVVALASVVYECEGCDQPIKERHKTDMLAAGQWIPTKPQNSNWRVVGYHLNSLYAPLGWFSWAEIAQQFEDAGSDETKLKTFWNTVLGLPWSQKGDAPKWESLFNRRENYKTNCPPDDVAIVTVGVDIQQDRIELEVVGWAAGQRSYSLDYRVLIGDTASASVWGELAKVVSETWTRPDGLELPMSRMAIDTGYQTSKVYDFCRKYLPTQVIPVKGQDKQTVTLTPPRSVDRRGSKGKPAGALGIWNVGVSILKSELYGRLRLEKDEQGTPPGYCHFPTAYEAHYFKMLTAEELQPKIFKGFTRYEWVKTFVRNEALDCRIYARAAAAMIGLDRWTDAHYKAATESLTRKEPVKGQTAARHGDRPKSSFWK